MGKNLLFSAKSISKAFHGTQALDQVDLEVYEGEVVGLIGENGAGKSTLLKIIIGVQPQSTGEMLIHGKPYNPRNPREANAEGVGMVFQEQSLITNLTIGQNIYFGYEKQFRKFGFINWNKMYSMAQKALDNVGAKGIPPRKKVSDLNFATRQLVEIAKVVNVVSSSGNAHCLILLDEPTSVLNESEVQRLFEEIRNLKKLGHSIIFVSHRLDEVLEISDRVYVYKDGKNVGNMLTKDVTASKLYEMMVGSSTTSEYYRLDQQAKPKEEVVLECVDLGLHGVFKHVSFKLHKGEVLGFCGVVGSGKEEICSVLCGDEIPTSGKYFINGKMARLKSPADALRNSILMVPKERLEEGIVNSLSVGENI
ncbi:MAG: sugar ABC transporter ATP-binding protein, partial [Desulfitobacterium hafniense]|nr:sugar ABC transporter ATP-binding protein [Desulfitobacterium hafniense]